MPDFNEVDTLEFPQAVDMVNWFGPSAVPAIMAFGAASHQGKRSNNEDHYIVVQRRRSRSVLLTNLPGDITDFAEDQVHILAVADGIGGAAFGELASNLALRTAFDLGHGATKWIFKVNEQEIEELKGQIETILRLVHKSLVERGKDDPDLTGMGTTLTGAYTIGMEALIAHVGDSRAYLFRNGAVERLTRDHTLAQEMLDTGGPPPSSAHHHVLTNCLGGTGQDLKVNFLHYRFQDGDRLLLCTDGLSDMVSDEKIAHTLSLHKNPQDACSALVDQALANGGKDNVTVVLADFALANKE
jgi:serine/threonine protein phosphatase PrpC